MPNIQKLEQKKTIYRFRAKKDVTAFDLAQVLECVELRFDEVAFKKVPPPVQKFFEKEE